MVPLADNDGQPFGEARILNIAQRLAMQFNGCTMDRGVEGLWYDGPTLYHDYHVRMILKIDRHRREEAVAVAKDIGRELRQKAIFLEVVEEDGIQILDID